MRLPLFPLHVVAFPYLPLPLHIFERRYRAMTRDLLASDNPYGGQFVVTMISAGREANEDRSVEAPLTVRRVGTICEIRRADRFADGRYALMAVGVGRARIRSVDHSGKYAVAEVTRLAERDGAEASELVPDVQTALDEYLATIRRYLAERDASDALEEMDVDDVEIVSIEGGLENDPIDLANVKPATRMERLIRPVHLPDDPQAASYAVAGVLQVELSRKQRLLEASDAAARLRAELALLQREAQLLSESSLAPMGRFEYHAN